MTAERSSDDIAADLGQRLERYFSPERYTALVRTHLRLGTVEDVKEAIQEAMIRIYARFADGRVPPPENLDAFVNASIRNVLIDRHRSSKEHLYVDLDKDGEDERSGAGNLPDSAPGEDDVLAWKQLLHVIFDRLPPKWCDVASMVMADKTPAEIGAAYRQNGYVLQRYARELICRILADLMQKGEPLSAAMARDFCDARPPPKRRRSST